MNRPELDPRIPHAKDATMANGLDLPTIALLVLAAGLATTGQLFLKAGMNEIGEISSIGAGDFVDLIKGVITTWQALVGLAAFGMSSLFWLIVLSRVPLSTAYPFVALSYIIILGFSVWVLNERPPLLTWGGALLIMSGIVMVGFGGFERG